MSLQHILLGMLREPASGYDLKQRFQQSLSHFWAAELAQIYPLLARMEKQGLLRSEKVASNKGPPRKLYHRTEAGRRSLDLWLGEGPQVRHDRLAWLAQVFFLHQLRADQRSQFFQSLRADFVQHLSELEEVERQWRQEDPRYPDQLPDEAFYPQLTLRLGMMKYRTIIDWCDECLQRLRQRGG
ncbi:MAG: PadR family transcriptional regulator [Wenzhouxiangellaceae bacterium]